MLKTLYKKELNYYLNNPVGYLIIILFAVFFNFLTLKDVFVSQVVSSKPFFNLAPWFLLVFIPALAMRIFAEEKKLNTIEVLLTLPIKESVIVFSKFLTLMSLVFIALVLTTAWFIFLSFFSSLYLPEVLVGYFGAILLSSALLSLVLFISNKTNNQVVVFLIGVVVIFFLFVLNSDYLASILPKIIIDGLSYFSPLYHYQNFVKGIIDLRSVFYFLIFSFLFLFLTIIDLEKRK